MSDDLLNFIKETTNLIPTQLSVTSRSSNSQESSNASSLQAPTEEDLIRIRRDLWFTVISSPHPQTAAAIENHFVIDTGYRLDHTSASLGFRSSEAFLKSDIVSDIIIPSVNKDELDEHGSQRFSAISFDDISHITNLMSESALTEEEKESRKTFFRDAKYSMLEYQEKAIEMREKIAEIANELMNQNQTDTVAWDHIQEAYQNKYGEQLNKKHLREAFPTGHPSKIVETYMTDEFVMKTHPTMTGNLLLQFRRPYSEVLKIFENAKKAVLSSADVIKTPEFRTRDNTYVDYVRERQKKDVHLQRKQEKGAGNFAPRAIFSSAYNRNPSANANRAWERKPDGKPPLSATTTTSSSSPATEADYERPDPWDDAKGGDQTRYLPNPRLIVPRIHRINYDNC